MDKSYKKKFCWYLHDKKIHKNSFELIASDIAY